MMSELLTTGQMIDQLKIGEVAESKNQRAYYDNCQLIVENKLTGEKKPFTIWIGDKSPKWRILPYYVSFEEAYKAGKQGKTINFHADNGVVHTIEHFDDSLDENRLSSYSLRELIEGNWSIED